MFDLIMSFKIIIILLFLVRLLHSLRSVEAREKERKLRFLSNHYVERESKHLMSTAYL